jgi:putative Mg2+ transporter-C (MgtC) family protein
MATNDPVPPAASPQPDHLEDLLDEAERESFPASDPPAVTPRRRPVATVPPVDEAGRGLA